MITLILIILSSLLRPIDDPPWAPPLNSFPAVVTFYAPERGGRNCDGDCSNTATGDIEEWQYGYYMACHQDLLGHYVTFEGIGTWRCMDNGDDVTILWSPHYGRFVLFFDALLYEEPPWNFALWESQYWCITDWDISEFYQGYCPENWPYQ